MNTLQAALITTLRLIVRKIVLVIESGFYKKYYLRQHLHIANGIVRTILRVKSATGSGRKSTSASKILLVLAGR